MGGRYPKPFWPGGLSRFAAAGVLELGGYAVISIPPHSIISIDAAAAARTRRGERDPQWESLVDFADRVGWRRAACERAALGAPFIAASLGKTVDEVRVAIGS